jgi:hypothetical protein
MLADRKDDLIAAINANRGASPLEPGPEGDLDDRDGEQRDKKDSDGSHVIPDRSTCRGTLASTTSVKFAFRESYKNVWQRTNDCKHDGRSRISISRRNVRPGNHLPHRKQDLSHRNVKMFGEPN